ncbi:MAG TPA: long-chain fatty acid--CoA ligase [Quisquiliibacterium sp.]|nr:long-chain fatty acid--CoA ligase [Quisquiliibacterium sp.]
MPSFYLTQALHRAIQQKPGRLATSFAGRRHTWAQFGERVARAAAVLRGLGVRSGERVAMMALNSDRYLEYYYATWWAGGVVNPVNIRWSPAEVAYSLDDCDTAILIVDDAFKGAVDDLRARSKALKTVIHCGDGETPAGMLGLEALIAAATPIDDALRSGDDLAGIFYTGGTTGFPKGVMLTHTNLASNALSNVAEQIVMPDGVTLFAAPMFHLANGAAMLAGMTFANTTVFVPSFTPVGVLEVIQSERATQALLVPTMIQMLVDHPDLPKYDTSSLRSVLYGASPISEGVMQRALAAFPNARFTQAYGMTELSPCATILPSWYHTAEGQKAGKMRSGGRATFTTEVRIVDAEDREVPRGTVGEICARGPGVMQGYWNKPELTQAAIREGWMHTGDAGYMDEDGFVFVVDRVKDMIVSGGENVYSAEVENAIARHPAVAACAVIGIPSERWGESVHAAIVLKPGQDASADEIIAHCRTLIAGYKCPRSVAFVDALPLSGAGKVLKTKLREPFWAGRQRNVA